MKYSLYIGYDDETNLVEVGVKSKDKIHISELSKTILSAVNIIKKNLDEDDCFNPKSLIELSSSKKLSN